jgi:microcystin-dependent protein
MRTLTLTLAAAAALVAIPGERASAQDAPALINYQGELADAMGQPVTGDHSLSFSVYDQPTGGALNWGPQTFGTVTLDSEGRFNVILGPTDDGSDPIIDAFGAADRFLEITVDGGSPIAPRQQFLSAPYALSASVASRSAVADRALAADSADNAMPAGAVVAHAGTPVPTGYLLCDGAAVSRSQFATLFAAIGTSWGQGNGDTTFNVPDLRGRFLRGVDLGAGLDPDVASREAIAPGGNTGGNVGSVQGIATALPNAAFTTNSPGNHNHLIPYSTGIGSQNGVDRVSNGDRANNTPATQNNGDHSHTVTGGGDLETRPVNAAVVWIIKI